MAEALPEQALEPQVIHIVAPRQHRIGSIAFRLGITVAVLAAGAAAFEKYGPGDIFPDLGLGEINGPVIKSPPAKVEASIAEHTYSAEPWDASIKGRIDVGAGIIGEKKDLSAKAKIDKMFFGDFLAAGNTKTATVSAVVHRVDGKVVDVTLDAPGLSNIQPRVDFTDSRNCPSINSNDDRAEIDKKIKDYQSKVDQGKKPSCDPVVEFGGLGYGLPAVGRTEKLMEVVQPTYTAAQIVIGAAGSITKAANEFNVSYATDLKTELEQQYPGAKVTVNISNQMTIEQQIANVTAELEKNNFVVTRVADKTNPLVVKQLRIESPDGTTIIANLDTPAIEKEPIRITNFKKSESKTLALGNGRG